MGKNDGKIIKGGKNPPPSTPKPSTVPPSQKK